MYNYINIILLLALVASISFAYWATKPCSNDIDRARCGRNMMFWAVAMSSIGVAGLFTNTGTLFEEDGGRELAQARTWRFGQLVQFAYDRKVSYLDANRQLHVMTAPTFQTQETIKSNGLSWYDRHNPGGQVTWLRRVDGDGSYHLHTISYIN